MGVTPPRIELEILGRQERDELVPLRTFARAGESLLDLLMTISVERTKPVSLDWYVRQPRRGTAVIAIEGRMTSSHDIDDARQIMEIAIDALATIEAGGDVRPLLSYAAIEQIRLLADLNNDGAGGIVLHGFGHDVPITAEGAERAQELLHRRLHSFGSVEGTVETISIHDAQPSFVIAHALDGYAITCRCDAEMLSRVKGALGTRIRVTGIIERRLDGRVESVAVAEFHILRSRDQLPQVSEIRGIIAGEHVALPRNG